MTAGIIIAGGLLLPIVFQQFQTARFGLQEVSNWNLVLGKAELKNLAMVFIKFTSGRLSWFPKWSYYLVAGSWSLVIGTLLFLSINRNKLLAFLFVLPLTIGLLISFWYLVMQYFRFLYLLVPMSVLLGLQIIEPIRGTINKLIKNRIVNQIGFIILIGYCVFSFVYLSSPQFHREDWKTVEKDINPVHPVYITLPSSDSVSYYRKDLTLFELRDISTISLPETVQVIPYVSEIYVFNYVSELEKKGCIKKSESTYRGPVMEMSA